MKLAGDGRARSGHSLILSSTGYRQGLFAGALMKPPARARRCLAQFESWPSDTRGNDDLLALALLSQEAHAGYPNPARSDDGAPGRRAAARRGCHPLRSVLVGAYRQSGQLAPHVTAPGMPDGSTPPVCLTGDTPEGFTKPIASALSHSF